MTEPSALTREQAIELLKEEYPNLAAVLIGCVSGKVSEWPMMKPELIKLVSTQRARVAELEAERAAWDETYLTRIAALQQQVEQYQARLEIDHHYDQDGKRVEIPPHKRDKQWDGIACRDETIKLQDRAVDEARKEREALREALTSCAAVLSIAQVFIETQAQQAGVSPTYFSLYGMVELELDQVQHFLPPAPPAAASTGERP